MDNRKEERIRKIRMIVSLREEWMDLVMVADLFLENLLRTSKEMKVVDIEMYDTLRLAKRDAEKFMNYKLQFDALVLKDQLDEAIEFADGILFRESLEQHMDSPTKYNMFDNY